MTAGQAAAALSEKKRIAPPCGAARLASTCGQEMRGTGYKVPRAPRSSLVEVARHAVEGRAELRADASHRGDRGNRDEGCDEAIFDGGRAALVANQLEKLGHGHSFSEKLRNGPEW